MNGFVILICQPLNKRIRCVDGPWLVCRENHKEVTKIRACDYKGVESKRKNNHHKRHLDL